VSLGSGRVMLVLSLGKPTKISDWPRRLRIKALGGRQLQGQPGVPRRCLIEGGCEPTMREGRAALACESVRDRKSGARGPAALGSRRDAGRGHAGQAAHPAPASRPARRGGASPLIRAIRPPPRPSACAPAAASRRRCFSARCPASCGTPGTVPTSTPRRYRPSTRRQQLSDKPVVRGPLIKNPDAADMYVLDLP
jgi:hypothetical protein